MSMAIDEIACARSKGEAVQVVPKFLLTNLDTNDLVDVLQVRQNQEKPLHDLNSYAPFRAKFNGSRYRPRWNPYDRLRVVAKRS